MFSCVLVDNTFFTFVIIIVFLYLYKHLRDYVVSHASSEIVCYLSGVMLSDLHSRDTIVDNSKLSSTRSVQC